MTAWINLLCASNYTDAYTRCKVMAREVWRELGLVSAGFEIEVEITVTVEQKFDPFSEYTNSYKTRLDNKGKKTKST